MRALHARRTSAISSNRGLADLFSYSEELPQGIYIIGRGSRESFCRKATVVPDHPTSCERQIILEQVIKAAFEATEDVRSWNIMSSHANAAAHTRDRLLNLRKPKVM